MSQKNFNIGDIVVCKNNYLSGCLTLNKEYIVVKTHRLSPELLEVYINNDEEKLCSYYAYRFHNLSWSRKEKLKKIQKALDEGKEQGLL